MPSFRCQAILFDLDGVLIDADLIYERHWKAWATRHQVSFERILEVHHGSPAARTIQIVAPHLDAVAEARDYNHGLEEDTDMPGAVAYPGVKEILEKLPPDRWAIATSASRKIARARLQYLGLPVPSVLITPEDVRQGKPAPDPYLKAAEGIGFSAEECLVIEDAPAGIDAARAAGARVIALTTTHGEESLGEADAIASSFADLEIQVGDAGLEVSW